MTGPPEARARRERSGGLWSASLPLILFLAVPLLALVVAVSPSALLHHLATPMVQRALWLTLRTTCVSTALCLMLGTPLAYLLARRRFRGRDVLDTLVDLPITIPPVVAGVALLLALGRYGLVGRYLDLFGVRVAFTTVAVVMAQTFIASPFFVKAARAGFESVDRSLEAAARTLGATPWRVFWTVTVPLARPALLSGALLAWARALSEFGATIMFAGNFPGRTQTLTLAVMTAIESDLDAAVSVSLVALLLALGALLIAKRIDARWSRRHV